MNVSYENWFKFHLFSTPHLLGKYVAALARSCVAGSILFASVFINIANHFVAGFDHPNAGLRSEDANHAVLRPAA